jgi:hypothetical protein
MKTSIQVGAIELVILFVGMLGRAKIKLER